MTKPYLKKLSRIACISIVVTCASACPSAGGDEDAAENGGRAGNGGTRDVTGSFTGDDDIIGVWDVTLTDDGDDYACEVAVSAGLQFDARCEDVNSGEYDIGCDYAESVLEISGSLDASTGTISIKEVEKYSGARCADYGFEAGRSYEEIEADADLDRVQTGPGTLGGTWVAKLYEWTCPNDEECTAAEQARFNESWTDCEMTLDQDGAIDVACSEAGTVEDDEDYDCESTGHIRGGIGDGRIVLELTETESGADCESDDDDETITIDAVRR